MYFTGTVTCKIICPNMYAKTLVLLLENEFNGNKLTMINFYVGQTKQVTTVNNCVSIIK